MSLDIRTGDSSAHAAVHRARLLLLSLNEDPEGRRSPPACKEKVSMLNDQAQDAPATKGALNLQRSDATKGEKSRWLVGKVADVPEGGRLVIDAAQTSVGLFRVEGKLYAYENICMHQGGPVCQGKMLSRVVENIDANQMMHGERFDDGDPHIICPWHGYEYSIKTGRHAGRPSIALRSVPVEEVEGSIYVVV